MLSALGGLPREHESVQAVVESIASAYNTLGNAYDASGNKLAALAAYERACALQPDFAMWQRNRAGTLIELGRLDEAAAAIATARQLEPEAARLNELDAELAQAQNPTSAPGANP